MSSLSDFLKGVGAQMNVQGGDLAQTAQSIETKVTAFLTDHNLATTNDQGLTVATESINASSLSQNCGIDDLVTLVEQCGIPVENRRAAVEQLGIVLYRMVGTNRASQVYTQQCMKRDAASNNVPVRGMETLYPASVLSIYANEKMTANLEAFGINIDAALPDMKLAITVTLLRFHVGLVPRVMPVRGIAQPNVQYIKETLEVYDLADVHTPVARMLDLYEDPSLIENNLRPIVPLAANDADGKFIVGAADGKLAFNTQIHLLELALDPAGKAYGLTKINRTDIVADGVKLKAVTFELSNGTVTETFRVEIPEARARLTRPSNADNAAVREGHTVYPFFLHKGSKTATGADSALFNTVSATVQETQGIKIMIDVRASIDLISSITSALGSGVISAHSLVKLGEGEKIDTTVDAIVTALNTNGGVKLVSWEIDARRSEENLRTTNVAIRSMRQPYSYDIPTGRNYVFDYAIGQTNAEENAENLTKVIRVGQDWKVLKIIIETLERVYNDAKLSEKNPLDENRDLGFDYVAGGKVKPFVFRGTLDMSEVQSIQDSNHSGDIKQHVMTYLQGVVTEIAQRSFMQQQLPNTTLTFKGITSINLLGNIIGAEHIHNHLVKDDQRDLGDGIEYRLVLPGGVVIEFVTTTFIEVRNQIILIPTIKGSVESELNFAHNWDYGTMVAQYTPSGDAAWHRLFANAREMPIVTNAIGALIDVTGVEDVTFHGGNGSIFKVRVDNASEFPVAEPVTPTP